MPRPNQLDEKRRDLLPVVARAFAELGFRRATTAQIAERCGVQETILYRLWPDKKAMFIAAIGYVYELSVDIWSRVLAGQRAAKGASSALRLLEYESRHMGQFGHHRIIFAGLNETDDADIRAALAAMYTRYQRFVRDHVLEHRKRRGKAAAADAAAIAWALIGLGTVSNICAELRLLGVDARRQLMSQVGSALLDARS